MYSVDLETNLLPCTYFRSLVYKLFYNQWNDMFFDFETSKAHDSGVYGNFYVDVTNLKLKPKQTLAICEWRNNLSCLSFIH